MKMMIDAFITNNQITSLSFVPYDQKYFDIMEKKNQVVTCPDNMVECTIDKYGLTEHIVDMKIKTDSFTVALMTIYKLIGEDGIINL